MEAKSVKIGWIFMLILGLYRIMTSISLMAMGQADISSGVYLATTGIAIVFITLASYKKAQKWSWWCLLLIGMIPLLPCSILLGINVWTAIVWMLFIFAISIPAIAILGKKSE